MFCINNFIKIDIKFYDKISILDEKIEVISGLVIHVMVTEMASRRFEI